MDWTVTPSLAPHPAFHWRPAPCSDWCLAPDLAGFVDEADNVAASVGTLDGWRVTAGFFSLCRAAEQQRGECGHDGLAQSISQSSRLHACGQHARAFQGLVGVDLGHVDIAIVGVPRPGA